MTPTKWKQSVTAMFVAMFIAAASTAQAQSDPGSSKWSAEVGIGWDNGISGNINSSGVGTLNNQVVVIRQNSYDDIYGTGLHLRFGGGYMFKENTEVRAIFTFQSLDADFVTLMGDIGVSNLYGQYSDYQTFGLDVGLRRYGNIKPNVRGYGEAHIGVGFVDKTDIKLIAPSINFVGQANDFYDQTAAFSVGMNAGILVQMNPRIGFFGELGLRWMSGMTEIDDLQGTGLDNINDKSSRWTLPFVTGIRFQF